MATIKISRYDSVKEFKNLKQFYPAIKAGTNYYDIDDNVIYIKEFTSEGSVFYIFSLHRYDIEVHEKHEG